MIELISLRKHLHRYPELSNQEFGTAEHITGFIDRFSPDRVIPVSGTGRVFLFDSGNPGPTVMFRAELDALPVTEVSNVEHVSMNPGVAHVCGHDGHMAILSGLAGKIAGDRPTRGRAALLFQPAEEVEQGAADVIGDPRFREIEPDWIFALHNIPGTAMHRVIVKTGSFAAASRGMTVRLSGRTSHAGEPEKGINPAVAVARIISSMKKMNDNPGMFGDVAFSTVIHLQLGEVSFGTSAGQAEMRFTLRAFEDSDMDILTAKAEKIVEEIAGDEQLGHEISYGEIFPATVNDEACVELIRQAASANQLPVEEAGEPFRWSEDFGYYTEKYRGGYFGLGSGTEQPALHNPDFDFPDALIPTGVDLFYSIYRMIVHQ